MNEVLPAIGISAAILLPVVVFIVIISMAAVKRGEAAQHPSGPSTPSSHDVPDSAHHVEQIATPPAKPAKAAVAAADEVNVGLILILGAGLFTLMMVLFLAVSFIEHLI